MIELSVHSLPIQLYLVDTFAFAASATGAASVSRLIVIIHTRPDIRKGFQINVRVRIPSVRPTDVR